MKFLILLICFTATASEYIPNRYFDLPDGVFEIDYSIDSKFIAAASQKKLYIFQGKTGALLQIITPYFNVIITSFSFNLDSTRLIIGFNNGSATLWSNQNSTFIQESLQYQRGGEKVTKACFIKGKPYAILVLQKTGFVIWNILTGKSVLNTFEYKVILSLSCSTARPSFAVGGGMIDTRLILYTVNDDGNLTASANYTNTFIPLSSFYSANENYLYMACLDGKIYKQLTQSANPASKIQTGTGQTLYKVRVSNNEKIIATVYKNNILIINQTASINALNSIDTIPTSLTSLALSSSGQKLSYVSLSGRGVIAGLCKQGQYYSFNVSKCLTCFSACSLCENSNTECYECVAGFYLVRNQCLKCCPGCLNCINFTNCVECDASSGFAPVQNGTCVCFQGHFIDGNICSKCVDGCKSCINNSSCNACYTERGFIPLQNGCHCRPKTYEKDEFCYDCGIGCQQCVNAETCITCDTAQHFIKINNTCQCEQGYYQDEQFCEKCSDGCQVCSNWFNCSTCYTQRGFIQVNERCYCKPRTYEINQHCLDCQRGCLECIDATSCLQCDASNHFIYNNSLCVCDSANHYINDALNDTCVCEPGYYEWEGAVCLKCSLGCMKCENGLWCVECRPDLSLRAGRCMCVDDRQFLDEDGICKNCNDTLKFCEECANAEMCTKCEEGLNRHLQTGSCLCDRGFYPDPQQICRLCDIAGCLQCTSHQNCTVCDAGTNWVLDGSGLCACNIGFVEISEECVKCLEGCLQCDQNLTCLVCDRAHHWQLNETGRCQCIQQYYQQDQVCKSCQPHCLQCTSGSECEECMHPFIYIEEKCQCNKGQYISYNLCMPCPEVCVECLSASNCTICLQSYTLDSGMCVKNRIKLLYILLMAGGASVIVVIAVVIIIKVCKRCRSRPHNDLVEEAAPNPFETDQERARRQLISSSIYNEDNEG